MTVMSTSDKFIDRLKMRRFLTPDYPEMKFQKEVPLFVYDDLKDGTETFDNLMGGTVFLGEGTTVDTGFYMKETSQFPLIFRGDKSLGQAGPVLGPVRGEIYSVTPRHILDIDKHYQNNYKFRRWRLKVIAWDQTFSNMNLDVNMGHCLIECYIYVADSKEWAGQNLRSRSLRHPNQKETHVFKKRPYYEWDTWEKDWPMLFQHNSPYGMSY